MKRPVVACTLTRIGAPWRDAAKLTRGVPRCPRLVVKRGVNEGQPCVLTPDF